MKEKEIIVKNKSGLHARPISNFVNKASTYKSDIFVIKDGAEINGKSVLSLLTLAAGFNTKLTIRVTGADEDEAVHVLSKLLEEGE
ncbi:MAG: HPr family phosphocarrier protein [Spirochaetes bacterium]|nr:HPr family phosphocarrier protein [Spirochaetota bacterium]